jgi:hypothetical protein
MINAMLLLLCVAALPCDADQTTGAHPAQMIVTIGEDGPIQLPGTVCLTSDTGETKKILIHAPSPEEDESRVVIGVRISALPEPLAAHLQRDGLMIANVSAGGPADQAGLERYDVVVRFAGRPIRTMEDLHQAVQDSGPGQSAEIVIIRGGQEQTLKITPVAVKELGEWNFKYEEPETDEVEQLQKYFGHRLKLGPHGMTFMMPHGRLKELPEDLEELLEQLPSTDWEQWGQHWEEQAEHWERWAEHWEKWAEQWEHGRSPFGIWITPDLPGPGPVPLDEADVHVNAQIRIRSEEDGQTLIIERNDDGTFTIERQDADGGHSSRTFESIKELRGEDPDAYETFQQFAVVRTPQTVVVSPDLKNLGVQQHEFQIELKRKLDQARDELERASEQLRKARTQIKVRRQEVESDEESDVVTRGETVTIVVDDGRITLTMTKDGGTAKFEFDSVEDFREREPELYQRFKKHLENTAP